MRARALYVVAPTMRQVKTVPDAMAAEYHAVRAVTRPEHLCGVILDEHDDLLILNPTALGPEMWEMLASTARTYWNAGPAPEVTS